MKKLLFVSLIIGATLTSCTKETTKPQYIDLSKDQVVKGGITNEKLLEIVNASKNSRSGNVDITLEKIVADVSMDVQFKNANGTTYWQKGTLSAGTELIRIGDKILLRPCGNSAEEDRECCELVTQIVTSY